ncbi:hypothetical protein CROQUDRAFT_662636 [Cronartium quercuum f. sp. fusiforme G11]|uniref:Uncharacterized protein n=1 Tax=Cronartium quercuum f. sp. fusiforme G11 TaxID=708437 RepID=A0A9P6T7V5_9BASI|nr:hypothetical protein CROQUDRAFT_662636 [Cronartium quercuum f. sp. fusiforme G11]
MTSSSNSAGSERVITSIEPSKRIVSPPPILPKLQTDGNGEENTFGFELLELARRQQNDNQALLHFLSGSSQTDQSSTGPQDSQSSAQKAGLNSAALSDDLIPSTDPCYLNLNLRDITVRLLHSITSQTIHTFITSLAQDSHQIYFGSSPDHQSSFNNDEKDMIMYDNRVRIRRSTEKNREALCQNARLESQLLVAQHLLEARSRTPPNPETSIIEDHHYADQIAKEVASELAQLIETREEGSDGPTIRKLISVTGNVLWDQLPIPL